MTRKTDRNTQRLTGIALMSAIVIVLAMTPIGMIRLPVIKATTVHIPVIIGAILFGPLAGAVLGGIFGICSVVINTIDSSSILSFVFSPFLSMTGISGVLKSLWTAVGCRMMIGVVAGWFWILMKKMKVNRKLALPVTGFIGSMTNTVFVMGSIYLLFAKEYAQVKNVAINAVWGLIMGTIIASGIPEAVVAAILTLIITSALFKVIGSQ
jgi:uncharacterized membrane protein